MEMNNLIKFMDQHGVDYDKKLTVAINDGCHEDYQNLWNNILQDVENYIRFGVNNGFNGDMKEDISKLTKLLVKIHGEQNGKKLAKLTAEREKIQKECEKIMKKESNVNIKAEVIKYIDAYIEGTETVLELEITKNRQDVLHTGVEKLNALKNALDNVVDVSTVEALAIAKNIINELKGWAKSVYTKMHSNETLAYVDQAIEYASQWANLREGVKKGWFVKDNSVKNVDEIAFNQQNEELCHVTYSKKIIDRINNFSENLQEIKKAIKENGLSEEKRAKKKEIEDKLAQLKKEINDLTVQYQNGELDDYEYDSRCTFNEEEIGYLQEDLLDYQNDVIMNLGDEQLQNRVIDILERVNDSVLKHKSQPTMLSYIGSLIDFECLYRVMNGLSTESDLRNVFELQHVIGKLDQIAAEQNKKLADEWRKNQELLRQTRRVHQTSELTEQQKADQQKLDEERKARIARRLGQVPQQNPVTPNQTNTNENNLNFIFTEEDK